MDAGPGGSNERGETSDGSGGDGDPGSSSGGLGSSGDVGSEAGGFGSEGLINDGLPYGGRNCTCTSTRARLHVVHVIQGSPRASAQLTR